MDAAPEPECRAGTHIGRILKQHYNWQRPHQFNASYRLPWPRKN